MQGNLVLGNQNNCFHCLYVYMKFLHYRPDHNRVKIYEYGNKKKLPAELELNSSFHEFN